MPSATERRERGKKSKTRTKFQFVSQSFGFSVEIIKEKKETSVHTTDKWWSCEIRCAQLPGTPQNQSEVEIAWEAVFDVNYN